MDIVCNHIYVLPIVATTIDLLNQHVHKNYFFLPYYIIFSLWVITHLSILHTTSVPAAHLLQLIVYTCNWLPATHLLPLIASTCNWFLQLVFSPAASCCNCLSTPVTGNCNWLLHQLQLIVAPCCCNWLQHQANLPSLLQNKHLVPNQASWSSGNRGINNF